MNAGTLTEGAVEHTSFEERRGEFMAAARLEYLQDDRGVYGVSIPFKTYDGVTALTYILRPDRLSEGLGDTKNTEVSGAVLQIFPRRMFGRGHHIEHRLVVTLAEAIHARGGFVGNSRRSGYEWWADNKADQEKNRQRYHGQNRMADRIANRMIRTVLETADQDALKTARRFPFQYRFGIYRAAATSRRAHQLIEAFPCLGANIYCHIEDNKPGANLVELGSPLKHIAGELSFPMALRRVKAGAAKDAAACHGIFMEQSDLVHAYLPETLPAQRRWLRAIRCAMPFGPPFVEWVARNVNEMPGRTILEIESQVENVSDWIKANYQASVIDALTGIPQYMIDACNDLPGLRQFARELIPNYVTRRFSSDMSLRTVFELSDAWHEAVANHQSNHSRPFPEPWAGPADVDGYQITPIMNSADLYREGKRMRHCVASYVNEPTWGESYFYHVEKEGAPIATVQLLREGTKPKVGHVRGPCNSIVDKKIAQILRKWVRQIKEVPALERPGLTEADGPRLAQLDDVDDEIPF